jgi:hypothetical protein
VNCVQTPIDWPNCCPLRAKKRRCVARRFASRRTAGPWASETRVAVDRPDGRRVLEFGRDLVEAPYRVVLQRPEAAVSIVANGLGAFEVVD